MYNKEVILRDGLNEGYKYFCDKEHPLAKGNSGMVLYHRHVASISIGRWITTNEVVHHINGNKLDNDSNNLEVLSKSEHAKIHRPKTLDNIFCAYCGVEFSPREFDTKYCCLKCKTDSSIKYIISKDELEKDIWEYPYSRLTKKYNLSDVGLKKRARALGCIIPPPYFHNKSISDKRNIRNEILYK